MALTAPSQERVSAQSPARLGRPIPFQAVVVPLLVLSMLPLPLVTIWAAGVVYAQLERLTSLYVGVLMSVTVTTVVGLWTWWHNPVNPIDVYLKGARPNINPDATLFLIVLSAGVVVWQHPRSRLWAPALALLGMGLVAAFLSYALNAWLGALGAMTVLIC